MQYYHGSPAGGLSTLKPQKLAQFDKPGCVYLTSLVPMALMYGIRSFEYTYGYNKEKQIHLDEYYPNALEELYGGRSAYVYICKPNQVEAGRIPNEWISRDPVEIADVIEIPDLLAEMKHQEVLGTLILRKFEDLSPAMRDWIRNAEAKSIRDENLLNTPGPCADYMRAHYPESWAMVERETQTDGYLVSHERNR